MSAVENQVAARRGSARAVAVASFAGRFLVIAITTYLGLLAVTFFIGRVIPIDPVLAVLGDRAPLNVVERTRREMGLDLPLVEQFYIYVKNALNGDFGTSVLTTNPVMTDIRRAFPATIELATLGTLIGSVLGVPLGVLAAVRRGSIIDQIVRIVGLIGYSVPIFWIGLLGLVLFYAKLKWVAFPGRLDVVSDMDVGELRFLEIRVDPIGIFVDHRDVGRASPRGVADPHQEVRDVAVDGRTNLRPLQIDIGLRKCCFGARKGSLRHLRIAVEHLLLLNRGGQRRKNRPPGVLRFLDCEVSLTIQDVRFRVVQRDFEIKFFDDVEYIALMDVLVVEGSHLNDLT